MRRIRPYGHIWFKHIGFCRFRGVGDFAVFYLKAYASAADPFRRTCTRARLPQGTQAGARTLMGAAGSRQ